jgi:AcrR family transcriptional regulator
LVEAAVQPEEKLTRVERKRKETRERIISAAERLMRKRPLDELTIAEITDAADVGHGTFYLHFKSKYEVVVPIIHQQTVRRDEAIQKAVADIEDPAEVLACSGRHMGRMILADPLWRWFMQESGMPVDDMREALGDFVARDFEQGLASGRFNVPETGLATSYLFGGIVNALLSIFELADPGTAIDQVIEIMLRVLGLPIEEARDIAHRPLQQLEYAG